MFCDYCGAENDDVATICTFCHRATPLMQDSNNDGQFASGTVLHDRYVIVSCIGQGGYGSVYKAKDRHYNDRIVALKSIDLTSLKSSEIIEATASFNSEVQVLSELKHSSLPRLYEYFNDAQHWYLVMDFIEGDTFERYLDTISHHGSPRLTQKDTLGKILRICIALCTVLDYLHHQEPPIIFRDLKPANVMLRDGNQVALIDFGIARQLKRGQKRDTMPLGSPGYASPEQYGKEQTTARSDIYSLGVILHEALTGEDPERFHFNFPPLRQYNPQAPQKLEQIVQRMLNVDPQQRPGNMLEVQRMLQNVLDGLDQRSYQSGYSSQQHHASTGGSPGSILSQRRLYWQGGQSQLQGQQKQPSKRSIPRRAILKTGAALLATSAIVGGGGYLAYQSGLLHLLSLHEASSYTVDDRLNPLSDPLHWSTVSTGNNFLALALPISSFIPIFRIDSKGLITQSSMLQEQGPVSATAFSPDGRYLALSSQDTVHIWDVQREENRQELKTKDLVTSLVWSSFGLTVAQNTQKTSLYKNPLSQEPPIQLPDTQDADILAWAPDNSYILAYSDGSTSLHFWKNRETVSINASPTASSAFSDTYTQVFNDFMYGVSSFAWAPDKTKRIAIGSQDGNISIWDTSSQKAMITYQEHNSNEIISITWSPDARYVASLDKDGELHIWSSSNGKNVLRGLSGEYKYNRVQNIVWWRTTEQSYLAAGLLDVGTSKIVVFRTDWTGFAP